MPRTRRAFLKAAGALSALAATAAVPVRAQTSAPTPAPTPTPAKPPDALAKLARERYGQFLTEEEKALLDDDMAALERRSARLRGYKLENAEEPSVDFKVVRR